MTTKIRTSESREAEAKKILESRPQRGKPGEGPEARVKPKVLTPEERQLAATLDAKAAAKERQEATAKAEAKKADAEPKAD